MNWLQGDSLQTHTGLYAFVGQDKGRLTFMDGGKELTFSVKEVSDMIKCGEWKQFKYVH